MDNKYTLLELKEKEVINIYDGSRLGFIDDIEVDIYNGKLLRFIVLGRLNFWVIRKR